MSESEDDLDYVEILKTINEKNIFLQNQEQNMELKNKFDESFKKYWDQRNLFLNIKDEFEINQMQVCRSNMIIANSRNQQKTQILKLEELNEKCRFLRIKSLDQQTEFEASVKHWNDKINELSNTLDEESQLLDIQNGRSRVETLLQEIEKIQESHIEYNKKKENEHIDYDLMGIKQLTCELLEGTMDFEEKLKKCTELETEINEYGMIIDDIQKQLHGV